MSRNPNVSFAGSGYRLKFGEHQRTANGSRVMDWGERVLTRKKTPIVAVVASVTFVSAGLIQAPNAQATTTTYDLSNSVQRWSAPGDGEVTITLRGAAGEDGAQNNSVTGNVGGDGGSGSTITVTRSVTSTDIIDVQVTTGTAGDGSCNGKTGDGGARAAVYFNAQNDADNAVVAGGGGAGGCNGYTSNYSFPPNLATGGDAGIPVAADSIAVAGSAGGDGLNPSDTSNNPTGGGAGGSSTVGSGGSSPTGDPGDDGRSPTGNSPTTDGGGGGTDSASSRGGGGGGGWYGGGGGGGVGLGLGAGGGGGSSLVGSNWTFVSAAASTSLDAQVVITFRATGADLTGLSLSDGTLTPAFTTLTTSYSATVASSVSSLTVTPTALDPNATITVDGSPVTSGQASAAISLDEGSNVILTVVVSADTSTTVTYTITITRGATADQVDQTPPTWFQAYSRSSANAPCQDGWYPSYAQWPNEGLGGWTCERRTYWSARVDGWLDAPGFYG